MPYDPLHFRQSATTAIKDEQLQTAIRRATSNVEARRAQALAELPDAQQSRQQGRGARLRALHDLPELLEQAERNVQAAGGTVLWAQDAEEANRLVLEICQRHDLKRGVKSKSMVTEEIGLVPMLEAHGIEMVETDLGEFIVQVMEDRPSHIVMPVMHMTKERVRDVFMEKLGMPEPQGDGVEMAREITAYARKLLREKFLNADFGISGANFLIAETGTVVVVTNEGNGRFTTSLPPVYIAITGIEKVIPTWEDFATLLQMLVRSATGQRLSIYTNMTTGPARPDDADGPQHFYLILLDNGRSDIYAGEYAEALACIRCGACMNICPVYGAVGGHSYGSIYPGPIGSILTPLFRGKAQAEPLPFASSLCGACKDACPVDIDIPTMLIKLRRDLANRQPLYWRAGMQGYSYTFRHPLLYHLSGEMGRRVTIKLKNQQGTINQLPFPFNGWTDSRDFPPLAEQSFHEWWQQNRESNA